MQFQHVASETGQTYSNADWHQCIYAITKMQPESMLLNQQAIARAVGNHINLPRREGGKLLLGGAN